MDVMKKIKFLLILFWNKCSFLHYDRKLLLKLSKCNFLNASGICNFYTCKKLLYWKQSSIVRHFCPTSPMDPIFHIWAVVTCTKAWGKNQGDKWLFTNCQKNEPNLMLGLLSIMYNKLLSLSHVSTEYINYELKGTDPFSHVPRDSAWANSKY